MNHVLANWQPVESLRNGVWQNAAAVTLVGVLAGTGGDIRPEQILQHFGTGSAFPSLRGAQPAATDQGLSVELKLIRDSLRLSVAETAQLFDVSRPTIYSWQNGNPISQRKAERLRAITNALAPHLLLLEAQVGRVAHRVIEGRVTLLQALAQGTDAGEAIGRLAGILERETAQREHLARRLQGRAGSRGSADLDTLG